MKWYHLIESYWNKLQYLFSFRGWRRHRRYKRVSYVKDFPDVLDAKTVYLQGTLGKARFAALVCPCGCGDTIELVIGGPSPSWTITLLKSDKLTFRPSIFRSAGCKSHFFIVDGRVQWC